MHGVYRKNLNNEKDDRWRKKGHAITSESKFIPDVCTTCGGTGVVLEYNISGDAVGMPDCPTCGGTGER